MNILVDGKPISCSIKVINRSGYVGVEAIASASELWGIGIRGLLYDVILDACYKDWNGIVDEKTIKKMCPVNPKSAYTATEIKECSRM